MDPSPHSIVTQTPWTEWLVWVGPSAVGDTEVNKDPLDLSEIWRRHERGEVLSLMRSNMSPVRLLAVKNLTWLIQL